MKVVSRLILGLVLLVTVISFSGCFGSVEVSEREFAEAVGIDAGESEYRISVLVKSLEGSEDSTPVKKVYKADGISVSAAIENIRKQFSKDLFLGHIKTVLLGSSMDKSTDILNDFTKNNLKISPSVIIAYTDTKAIDMLSKISESDEDVQKLIKLASKRGETIKNNIVTAVAEKEGNFAPVMKTGEDGIYFSGIRIIEDYPYYVTPNDCRNIGFIRNKSKGFSMIVSTRNTSFYADISQPKCKLETNKEENSLKFILNLSCSAKFEDNSKENYELLQKQLTSEIRKTVEYCRLRKLNLTAFNSRALLAYPELTALTEEQFNGIMYNAEYEINVSIKEMQ